MKERSLRVAVGDRVGDVSAILLRPDDARSLLVLAHGAGAGMQHPFMEAIATRLAERGMATLRYQFPFTESGKGRPDPPAVLLATVRAAVAAAAEAAPDLPLFAGGKSMGGRMTSQAAAKGDLSTEPRRVRGLVFFGFPLHAAGKPSADRGAHLADVLQPMLFLQGTRDSLADLTLLTPICEGLGHRGDAGGARLHVIEGADHSFHVPKKSGRTDDDVLNELADVTAEWATTLRPLSVGRVLKPLTGEDDLLWEMLGSEK